MNPDHLRDARVIAHGRCTGRNRPRWTVAIPAALLLIPALAAAQNAAVDEFVQKQMQARQLPGVSVAVVQNGQTVLAKGYGTANLEQSTPATEHTVYQLASVTKQFTATAVMMLVEEGKLSLDDRLTQLMDGMPDAWRDVTLWHLLNHTSGIKSYTSLPDFFQTARKDYTPEEIVALVAAEPLDFAPGAGWSYNNSGYFLLGMIIESVSGQKYGAFLNERIFTPLGMTTARVNDLTEIIPNRAQGYARNDGTRRIGEYVSPTQPFSAGALTASVLDMAKWDAALDDETLLKRSTLEQMWTPTRLADGQTRPYGFGWQVDEYRTRPRLHHGGGIQGFSTDVARFPDDRTTVIVLVNQQGSNPAQLSNGIAALYIPALAQNAPQPISDADPATTRFLREVITTLATGTGERDWFTAEGQAFFFPDRIKEGRQLLGSLGELSSFELMEESERDNARVREYRAVFGTTAVRVIFTLANDGKISGIRLRPEQ